ncbi:hypothetical protein IF1G_03998 [Cordyceps javanica]|uniref:Uncharacterized protein n=1 Tax=Cordyceps javanica TaxID=43265 RepID=A0A545V4W4_9HYPO|nr:hypothetical protein IF1G_03998 [Cordyceps javanica]
MTPTPKAVWTFSPPPSTPVKVQPASQPASHDQPNFLFSFPIASSGVGWLCNRLVAWRRLYGLHCSVSARRRCPCRTEMHPVPSRAACIYLLIKLRTNKIAQ